jgi:hypothetical protein
MDPKEKTIEDGLAITEMERGAGWQLIVSQLKEEKENLLGELRRIDLDGRSLESIGSDYISRIQRINAIEFVLNLPEDYKARKEEAEKTI